MAVLRDNRKESNEVMETQFYNMVEATKDYRLETAMVALVKDLRHIPGTSQLSRNVLSDIHVLYALSRQLAVDRAIEQIN